MLESLDEPTAMATAPALGGIIVTRSTRDTLRHDGAALPGSAPGTCPPIRGVDATGDPEGTRSATCVECGATFLYRLRGKPQVVCGPECKATRVRRQTATRAMRYWLRRADGQAVGGR